MARSVTYSVAPRINPREKDEAPKYYGRVQANGDINVREMSERIQQSCTVHKADVQAVLVALEDVIIKGSADRLTPILMTAFTSALALVPMIINGSASGNEIQSPMAVVVLGGLLSSTLLNIFVVPAVYRWVVRKGWV